jgi:hypothetical protein
MTYRRKLYTGWQIGYEYEKKKSANVKLGIIETRMGCNSQSGRK